MDSPFTHAVGEWLAATTRTDIENLALSDHLAVRYVPARRTVRVYCISAPFDAFEFPVKIVYAGILYEILERFALRRFAKPTGAEARVH